MHQVFTTLRPYKESEQLEFLLYSNYADYPDEICTPYGEAQGLKEVNKLCPFMQSLGLTKYNTGEKRMAWQVFVDEVKNWQSS